jgi:hypothetical protein
LPVTGALATPFYLFPENGHRRNVVAFFDRYIGAAFSHLSRKTALFPA